MIQSSKFQNSEVGKILNAEPLNHYLKGVAYDRKN